MACEVEASLLSQRSGVFTKVGTHVPGLLPCNGGSILLETCLKQLADPPNQRDDQNSPKFRPRHDAVNDIKKLPEDKESLLAATPKPEDDNDHVDEDEESDDQTEDDNNDIDDGEVSNVQTEDDEHVDEDKDEETNGQKKFSNHPDCQKDEKGFKCCTRDSGRKETIDTELNLKHNVSPKTELVSNILENKRKAVLDAKTSMNDLYDLCEDDLEENKQKCLQLIEEKFESLKKSVEEERLKMNKKFNHHVDHLDQQKEILTNIGDQSDNTYGIVKSIEESIEESLMTERSYEFFEYQPHKDLTKYVERLCEGLKKNKKIINFAQKVAAAKSKASEFNCSVTRSFITSHSSVYSLTLLDNTSIVVLGEENDRCVVTKYDMSTGQRLSSAEISGDPKSITDIRLCDRQCIAISFWPGERIEFRDASDLGRVVKVARTAPDRPLVLSRSPDPDSDQLLYMNWTDFHVKQLNCRTSSLRPAHHNRLKVNTPVADFCVAGVAAGGDDSDDHSQSVVTVSGARIEVFDLTTKLLNFRLCGHLAGVAEPIAPCSVTATRWGHVLVSDRDNQCVHMFNLQADDPYMGVLLQARDLGLGKPCKIRWCEKTSSIVVVLKSTDRNETSIGVIKVR